MSDEIFQKLSSNFVVTYIEQYSSSVEEYVVAEKLFKLFKKNVNNVKDNSIILQLT